MRTGNLRTKLVATRSMNLPGANTDATKADIAEYKADGFKYLKSIPVSSDQYHYPNFTTDWLPDVLKYMDASTADLKLPADNGTATPLAVPDAKN